jgi:sortase (surface protein transpeptidase)
MYRGRHTAAAQRAREAGGRAWVPGWLGTAAVVVGGAAMLMAVAPLLNGPPVLGGAQRPAVPPPPLTAPLHETVADLQVANPARVIVPDIDVDAAVVPLNLNEDGTLEVPEEFDVGGWYEEGPEPGEVGAAVIAGHVDSYTGPAVFSRLDELEAGDEITVKAVNRSSIAFVIEHVEQHPKDRFPTAAVYGPTPEPTLRLITCGGTFDRAAGTYRDNVVVYARIATAWRPAIAYSST